MGYTFAEGLIDEVIAYLTDNLPAKLGVVAGEMADTVELRAPIAYLKRDPDHPRQLTSLPVVYVKVPRGVIVDWREASARQNHLLWLYLVDRDSDPETLARKMYGYGQALWRTLVDGEFSGQMSWKLGIGQTPVIDFSPALTDGSDRLSDVKLELAYQKLETES